MWVNKKVKETKTKNHFRHKTRLITNKGLYIWIDTHKSDTDSLVIYVLPIFTTNFIAPHRLAKEINGKYCAMNNILFNSIDV